MKKLIACAAMLLGIAGAGAGMGAANAAPGNCSNENPYPSTYLNTCVSTAPFQQCAKWRCSSLPGTPGKWDINGRYTPKVG